MKPKYQTPFSHVYRELLRKTPVATSGSKIPKDTSSESPKSSSIDNILEGDTEKLLDKIMNSARSIFSRLTIHQYTNNKMDSQLLTVSNKLLELERLFFPGTGSFEQMENALTSEIHAVERQKLMEQLSCWKDLQEPMRYFIHLFHEHKALLQDKKLLEE